MRYPRLTVGALWTTQAILAALFLPRRAGGAAESAAPVPELAAAADVGAGETGAQRAE